MTEKESPKGEIQGSFEGSSASRITSREDLKEGGRHHAGLFLAKWVETTSNITSEIPFDPENCIYSSVEWNTIEVFLLSVCNEVVL